MYPVFLSGCPGGVPDPKNMYKTTAVMMIAKTDKNTKLAITMGLGGIFFFSVFFFLCGRKREGQKKRF